MMKASNRLSVVAQKVPKTYGHLPGMMSRAIEMYVDDSKRLHWPKQMQPYDPQMIAPTISGVPFQSTC